MPIKRGLASHDVKESAPSLESSPVQPVQPAPEETAEQKFLQQRAALPITERLRLLEVEEFKRQ